MIENGKNCRFDGLSERYYVGGYSRNCLLTLTNYSGRWSLALRATELLRNSQFLLLALINFGGVGRKLRLLSEFPPETRGIFYGNTNQFKRALRAACEPAEGVGGKGNKAEQMTEAACF